MNLLIYLLVVRGTDIVYSVTEDSVYDYTTTVDGMNIINTIIPSKPQAPGSSSSSSSSSSSTVVKKALPKQVRMLAGS